MRPVLLVQTGTGPTTPFIPDIYQNPFNIGIGVVQTGGVGTWAVEHCFDFTTVMSPTWNGSTGVTWFANSGLGGVTGIGTSLVTANGNYAFAVAAIRLNVYNGTNTGGTTVVSANFIQSVNSP